MFLQVFILFLALIILNNNIQIPTGTNTTSSFNYSVNADNLTLLTSSQEEVTDIYSYVSLEGTLSHLIGYWLAIVSFIGFVGILIGIRHSKGFKWKEGKRMFKIKIKEDEKVIAKARVQNIDDFDNIFTDLKKKFGGKKNG